MSPPPSAPSSPPSASSPWPARLEALGATCREWVTRPRVTLCLVGGVLVLAGLMLTDSVWTLPLMIVGAVMILVAWIGHRLEGRFAVQWGQTGTELAFRATVKPARSALTGGSAGSRPLPSPRENDAEASSIIEGEAHTVEIDVAELRALIAAAESHPDPAPDRPQPEDIRIHRVADDATKRSQAAG